MGKEQLNFNRNIFPLFPSVFNCCSSLSSCLVCLSVCLSAGAHSLLTSSTSCCIGGVKHQRARSTATATAASYRKKRRDGRQRRHLKNSRGKSAAAVPSLARSLALQPRSVANQAFTQTDWCSMFRLCLSLSLSLSLWLSTESNHNQWHCSERKKEKVKTL